MPIPLNDKEYEKPDEGFHDAVLSEVKALGFQQTMFGAKDRVQTIFTLATLGKDGKPLTIAMWFNKSRHQTAKLAKAIMSITGKFPQPGFDIESLRGAEVRLLIEHTKSPDGRVFAAVVKILPRLNGHGVDVTDADVQFPGDNN